MKFNYFNLLCLIILLFIQKNYNLHPYNDLLETSKNQVLKYSIFRDEAESGEVNEKEENQLIKKKPIVICLGQSCFALLKIREFGFRWLAYPFDWNVTYHGALMKLIKNDFSQFLDERFIHFENHARIWNTLYGGGADLQHGFTLAHVCSADATKENFFQQFFPILKERMERRIRRFYKALNSGKHVYFVRGQVYLGDQTDVNRENITSLVKLIKNKFPKLQFTVIAVNYSEDCKINWNIPNVVNFHHSGEDNEESSKQWKKIFQSVGLLSKD